MNQENALPRMRGQLYYPIQPQARRGRVREKDRDPYDGLRPWSAITHGAGAVFALAGTLLLFARSIWMGLDGWHLVSFLIYGLSMVGLYTASTLYHCLNTSVRGRIRLRKYDHASIYFLIAGTYTPMCLVVLRQQGAWGWSLFGAVWGLALAGLILTLAWITAPRWLTAGIYIFMGWMAQRPWRPYPAACPPPDSSGFWAAACSIPWAACSMRLNGPAETIAASAATRFSTCSFWRAPYFTFS